MSVPVRIALLVVLIAALVGFGLFVGGDDGSDERMEAATRTWRSSVQCARCHPGVWDEWVGSHHQIAYLNPEVRQLSDDFRNKECQACHLPRPIAVIGYGKRTLHRTTLPDEGVSCLTCHLGRDGEILGRTDMPEAPCKPRASAELPTVEFCASCHNQHGTTDQWRASSFAESGVDCNQCHMPEVARAGGRRGFDHAFRGSHDVDVLRSAVRLSAAVEGDELALALENHGAGHNFPTEERSRAADLMVRFESEGDAGEWQRAHRFRLPYRSEPLPDTTLPSGETEKVRMPIPDGTTAMTVRLWYRLTPYCDDEDPRSALLLEQQIELREGGAVAGEMVAPPPRPGSPFDPAAEMESSLTGADVVVPDAPEPLVIDGLPPLAMSPRLDRFAEMARSGPAAPDEERMAELRDLMETAFLTTDARLQRMAQRSLLEAPDAHWVLESGLESEEVAVRRHAAYHLGELGEQASIPPLLLRLKNEEDPSAFAWIAGALAKLDNHAGLPYLDALMAREGEARELAGQTAIEICRAAGGIELSESPTYDELRTHLMALHDEWQRHGVVAGVTEPAEAEPLTTARLAAHVAHLEDFQLRAVDEARFVLSRAGVLGVPLLEEAVHASEPYLRTHSLEILRNLGAAGRAAAPAVLPLLGDELSRVDAIRVLGRMEADIATPFLLPLLDASDPELRAAAARALGEIGVEAATARLEELLSDEAEPMDVRVMAAFGLAILAPESKARAWLEERRDRGDYHGPTIVELLDRLDRQG